MKKSFALLFICLCFAANSQAQYQIFGNKGNRLQTYPKVTETNPVILAMMEQVDTINIFNTVSWMQQYIRNAASSEALLTQNYLLDRFEELDLDTYVHHHTHEIGSGDTLDAGNIVAIQRGTEFPDEYIIISSHYDHPDGPGADDNASGTAGVLECARILSQHSFKRSILYVPFNGEEFWMVGSYPFTQKCANENMDILGVFNFDMIGWWPEEMDTITMYSGYSEISKTLFEYYSTVANLYRPDMPTYRFSAGDSYGGDHMSFNIYDYPALYIGDIEYHEMHPCYHQPCDTIGNGLNCFALAEGFVQATLASVAELANGYLPPQNFSAVPNQEGIMLTWDFAPEAISYKVFKDGEFLNETTDSLVYDNAVQPNEEHEYFVIGIKENGVESGESNHDKLALTNSLALPYFNDFENGIHDFYLNSDSWHLTGNAFSGDKCLNVINRGDNCLFTAELNWFSIPDSISDISLTYYLKGKINSIWHNAHFFVEVSTNRKTWHKLEFVKTSDFNTWTKHTVSLNQFIGNPFVQVRFRLESSGSDYYQYQKNIYIDDVAIDFLPWNVTEEKIQNQFFDFQVVPNPNNGTAIIITNLEGTYSLSVYSLLGIKIMEKQDFCDGMIDLSSLSKGIYFIQIKNKNGAIAKRMIIQ
jgi:Predicted aminopeptidases